MTIAQNFKFLFQQMESSNPSLSVQFILFTVKYGLFPAAFHTFLQPLRNIQRLLVTNSPALANDKDPNAIQPNPQDSIIQLWHREGTLYFYRGALFEFSSHFLYRFGSISLEKLLFPFIPIQFQLFSRFAIGFGMISLSYPFSVAAVFQILQLTDLHNSPHFPSTLSVYQYIRDTKQSFTGYSAKFKSDFFKSSLDQLFKLIFIYPLSFHSPKLYIPSILLSNLISHYASYPSKVQQIEQIKHNLPAHDPEIYTNTPPFDDWVPYIVDFFVESLDTIIYQVFKSAFFK